MTDLTEFVRRRLRELDLGPIEAATKGGLERTYIRDIVDGRKKSIRADKLDALAAALNVPASQLAAVTGKQYRQIQPIVRGMPVAGAIQAGSWLDTTLVDAHEETYIPVAYDGRFRQAAQYALLVQGDSMNKEFQPGTYVTCIPFFDSGLDLRDGMIVHVERHRDGGRLVEVTLKKVELRREGVFLVPQSTNPKHHPIKIDGDDDTEIVIKGIIIGNWRPVDY